MDERTLAPLRIGLIGASRVATYAAIDAARAAGGVEVVAVAAREAARARSYAATHGIARWHDDYAALLASPDIDLVYIGTPPSVHRAQALLAVGAGKHLLVEKPFAMNAGEARAVLAAADAAGVQVFEAMHSLHHPLFARLKQLLPELGAIMTVEARFDAAVGTAPGEFRWRAGLGGGALMDLGVYPLAWCRFLLGEGLTVITADARRRDGVDAAFSAELRMGEVAARVTASMDAPRHSASLLVTGARGRLLVDNPLAPQRGNRVTVETAAGSRSDQVDGPSSYAAQMAAVRDALADRARWPRPHDDFVRSMAAIDAVRTAMGG
ncbi:Gfo/Idh/MocA family protein [Sphingomonas sp.]|uniref:Gfo/Idh/MocA family protein n=1 Tax=Sphingomonas sp. TaxID=28214 RepID=UPI003CC5BAE8